MTNQSNQSNSSSRIVLTFPHAENSCLTWHGFHDLQLCAKYLAWLTWVEVCDKMHLYGCPCEMDFSPLVSESHPRRKWLGRDSETRGEKNPSHMENHIKCISSQSDDEAILSVEDVLSLERQFNKPVHKHSRAYLTKFNKPVLKNSNLEFLKHTSQSQQVHQKVVWGPPPPKILGI